MGNINKKQKPKTAHNGWTDSVTVLRKPSDVLRGYDKEVEQLLHQDAYYKTLSARARSSGKKVPADVKSEREYIRKRLEVLKRMGAKNACR